MPRLRHIFYRRFYFRHRGKFIRLRSRGENILEVKFRTTGWLKSTPSELAEILSGEQLARIFETSRGDSERAKALAALAIKFNVQIRPRIALPRRC